MLKSLKNISRILSIARTLAHNDLLWVLKDAGIPIGIIKTANDIFDDHRYGLNNMLEHKFIIQNHLKMLLLLI